MRIPKAITSLFGLRGAAGASAPSPALVGMGGTGAAFTGNRNTQGAQSGTAVIPAPPALRDADELKERSEVVPGDLKEPPPTPDEDERRIVSEVMRQFQRSAVHNSKDRRFSELCRRFEEGEQHLVIDDAKGIIDHRGDDTDEWERSHTVNVISPLMQKVNALVTQNDPDVTIGPIADTPANRQAAEEARSAVAHSHRKWKHRQQIEEAVRELLRSTDSGIKLTWDKRAEALLPEYDPRTGELSGAVSAVVGDVHREVITGDELYFDPAARKIEEAGWVIHARNKPLSWFSETYGKVGYYVRPDAFVGESVSGDSTFDAGSAWNFGEGGSNSNAASPRGVNAKKPNGATCYELWEKPTGKFRKGRLIVVAGGRVLFYGPWPYDKKDKFPFVLACFKKNPRSPRGFNLVGELLDAQVTINREWSRILARLDVDKRVILTQKLSGTGADLADTYKEHRDLIEVFYNPGTTPPQIAQFPPINEQHFQMLDRAYAKMQDISGVVDILQGKAPAGVTAGVAIDLLQSQSQSIFRTLITSIEFLNVDIAEWEIALTGQFAIEERLVMMDDSANTKKALRPAAPSVPAPGQMPGMDSAQGPPQIPPMGMAGLGAPPPMPPSGMPGMPAPSVPAPPDAPGALGALGAPAGPQDGEDAEVTPLTRARAFKSLNSGGKVYVKVEPGSATPRSIAGQNQFALELYDRAAFGPPGDPRAARLLIEAVTFNGSDRLTGFLDEQIKAQDTTNGQMADLQQQLAQAQQENQKLQMRLLQKPPAPPAALPVDPRELQDQKHQQSLEAMHTQAALDVEKSNQSTVNDIHRVAVEKQLDIDAETEKKKRGLIPPPARPAIGKAKK